MDTLELSMRRMDDLPWWGGEVKANARGEFVLIEEEIAQETTMPFPGVDRIRRNFRLIYGIGEKNEELLHSQGYQSLDDLAKHQRWGRAARELLTLINERRLDRLLRYGAKEDEILGFFNQNDLVILDLETTGFYQVQPLFLIGTLSFRGNKLILRQYVARNYEEEPAILHEFLADYGNKSVMVSYNGRSFDYPYLKARLRYHRFVEEFNPFQLDLLSPTRRAYRPSLANFRLRTVEENLLGVYRSETFSGGDIPDLYHRFIMEGDTKLLSEIIEHNAQDVISMAALLRILNTRNICG